MAKTLKANLMDDSIISVLRKFMIFEALSKADVKKILEMETQGYQKQIAKLCQYDAGEPVIREGEFDCWSFWVVKGVFDVIQDGRPIASFSSPGEIFGEMSVLEGIPRTASVISVTKSVCLCIDMSVIENMADDHIRETVKKGFYKVILDRLGSAKGRMIEEKKDLERKYAGILNFEQRIKSKSGNKT